MIEEEIKAKAIKDLQELQAKDPDRNITRDYFHANSQVTKYFVQNTFGTFNEFRAAAGISLNRAEREVRNKTALHASLDAYRGLNAQAIGLDSAYERDGSGDTRTLIVAGDIHDEEVDPFYLRCLLEATGIVEPDVFVINGDIFDLPEFGKYTTDPRDWNPTEKILFVHNQVLRPIREIIPDAQIDLISGNHECVARSTNILTSDGWKRADQISMRDRVASFDNNGRITYDAPIGVKTIANQPLIRISGSRHDELVSENHNIYLDGTLQKVNKFVGKTIDSRRFTHFGNANNVGLKLSDEEIRLINWVVMDGCIVSRTLSNGEIGAKRIQFKLSKGRKIDRLERLLQDMGIEYTLKECKKAPTNKMQPYYIRIYGDAARYIYSLLGGVKQLPNSFRKLNKAQLQVFLEELRHTDGEFGYSSSTRWTTTNKSDADIILMACITNGVQCYYTNAGTVRSGFSEVAKKQYLVKINSSFEKSKAQIDRAGCPVESGDGWKQHFGDVVAVQSKHGTLITMRNGKPAFTGNCRWIQQLASEAPATMAVLDELHGFNLQRLFGLDRFEINLVIKNDLAAYTKTDVRREIAKNYKVYWNNFLCHHFPQGRSFGVPGVNGHHHNHIVWSEHNFAYGSYEWHQSGAGHMRRASFTEAEKWSNGFVIASVHLPSRSVCFDYVDTTNDMAVVAGKFMYRTEQERTPFYARH